MVTLHKRKARRSVKYGSASASASSASSAMLAADLPRKVAATYQDCLASKQVFYYDSKNIVEDNHLKTEIRLCEALARKPGPTPEQKGRQTPDVATSKKKDVLAYENWDDLLVDTASCEYGEEYGILLNKFAVVPHHFLLVTKHDEAQKSPLTPPQLLTSYRILNLFANAPRSADSAASELLCFFNCGDLSGASQPHKHVQFAPKQGEGSLGHFATERAAEQCNLQPHELEQAFTIEDLPYAHYIRRLDQSLLSGSGLSNQPERAMQHLQKAYLSLLDSMIDGLRALPGLANMRLGKDLSYNLLMTRNHMHIIPRRYGGYYLPPQTENAGASGNKAQDDETNFVGCNSLAFTGNILVKNLTDVQRLKDVGGVFTALAHCGFPKGDLSTHTAEV